MDEILKNEKKTEQFRIDKIKNWLKNPYNISITLIVIAISIYRLYWFFKLGNQPLWWDEADYMNIARSWAGGAYWGFNPIRPVVLPIIGFLFYSIGLGEMSIRFLILLASIGSTVLIYLAGKTFYNKKTGLIAAFILSIFWSFNFYSFRILVDILIPFLWLATIYLFFDAYYNDKSWKQFAIAGIFLGLAFLTKLSTIALIGAIGVYLLTTEKSGILKNKNILIFWASSLITVLPYFIWQQVAFGSPIAFYLKARAPGAVTHYRSFLQSLYNQTIFSVQLMHYVLAAAFILGAILLIGKLILMYDKMFVKKTATNKDYFVFLWIAITLIFFGYLNYGDYMDERYYFIFYIGMFIVAAEFIIKIYEFLKKYSKEIAAIVIVILLAFMAYQNITQANQTIQGKAASYSQVRDAGYWLKENTAADEIIWATQEITELQYSSNRVILQTGEHFNNSQQLEDYIKTNKTNYLVLVLYYPNMIAEWEVNFFFNSSNNLEAVKYYEPFLDKEGKIPLVTIFKVKSSVLD